MDNPDLYDKNSDGPNETALKLVPYLVSRMNWKVGEQILDVGSGPGYVTAKILLPSLESVYSDSTRHIVGVDINRQMAEFSSQNYKHPQITFLNGDLMKSGLDLPRFDKIFSFYTIHWVMDKAKMFARLYNLLKSGGEIGFYCLADNHDFVPIWEDMSKNPIWAPYHHGIKDIIPREIISTDPARDMKTIMESVGFVVNEARLVRNEIHFQCLDDFLRFALAVNPFFGKVPDDMQPSFKADFCRKLRPLWHPAEAQDSPSRVRRQWEVILVRGQKH